MSNALLSLIMDFAVLAALAGTIYVAMRLSKSLNNFRSHRNEMKSLIAELAKNINEAQTAIEGLKATSNIAADNLDDMLHDSRRMAEELKMVNETSNSLANRLEGLASKNRNPSQPVSGFDVEEEYFEEPDAANTDDMPPEPPSFFIHDREFDDEADEANENATSDLSANNTNNNVDNASKEFISEAERELLAAIKRKKSGTRST